VASSIERRVNRLNVDNLRASPAGTIAALTQDVVRQHVERIEPSCIADLFALSELELPAALSSDLRGWAAKATREIHDLPEGEVRSAFLAELAELPAADVPQALRAVVEGLAARGGADTASRVQALTESWAATPPAPVVLPVPKARSSAPVQSASAARTTTAEGAAARRTVASKTPRAGTPKTPARDVDPRRAEWVRQDVVRRLGSPEYAERGLRESILLAGIRHRSPYSDLTDAEIKSELRRMEKDRRVKHTADRWLIR
jgi:hypothetical protein